MRVCSDFSLSAKDSLVKKDTLELHRQGLFRVGEVSGCLLAEEGRSYLPMNSKGDASMTGIVKVLLAICLKELLPGLRFRVESFGYRI